MAGNLEIAGTEIRFVLNEQIADLFANFSGDLNPLHIDKEFARRSKYRQPIAHGMLQVLFIPFFPEMTVRGQVLRVDSIAGRFVEPIFYGDEMVMRLVEIEAMEANEKQRYSFECCNARRAAVVSTVTLEVSLIETAAKGRTIETGSSAKNRDVGVVPRDASIEDFAKGDRVDFGVRVSRSSRQALLEALSGCIVTESAVMRSMPLVEVKTEAFALTTFLSTLVGMRLPGQAATFLEFSLKFLVQPECDQTYTLTGEVSHASKAALLLKSQVSFETTSAGPQEIATGEVVAQVDSQRSIMPSIEELKSEFADLNLKGKVALVTGASRGLGETIAKLLAVHGCKVAVNYFSGETDAQRVVDEIQSVGGTAIAVGADIRCDHEVVKMVSDVKESFGRIDILINNAVNNYRSIKYGDVTWNEIQEDIDVNVKGAFNCCKSITPIMIENGGGKIVNIASVAVDNPPPDQLKYVVSKSALIGLSRSMAVEFAAKNIQVNTVVPNFVETDLVNHIQAGFRKKIAADIPMNRIASPGEIAQAVAFLASSYSNYMTGQKLVVSGGSVPFL